MVDKLRKMKELLLQKRLTEKQHKKEILKVAQTEQRRQEKEKRKKARPPGPRTTAPASPRGEAKMSPRGEMSLRGDTQCRRSARDGTKLRE